MEIDCRDTQMWSCHSVFGEMLDDDDRITFRFTEFTGDDPGLLSGTLSAVWKTRGMEKLVIDLRDNPGGLLDFCVRAS